VLLVIAAAVGFLLWYTVSRDAAAIQPLVPALQSWWMKIHVPANFIGYGTFALAAMVGTAYLLKSHGILADRLPALDVLDDVMYKAISVGFAFFTVATILGALWAAEAWGGYWSWDPKETWALIVWLNYAAWLHMRLMSRPKSRRARSMRSGASSSPAWRHRRRRRLARCGKWRTAKRSPRAPCTQKLAATRNPAFSTTEPQTSFKDATNYNNYYEFGTDKGDPAANAHTLRTRPWTVQIEGEVKKPMRSIIDSLVKLAPLEERSTACAASKAGRW
jgi:hypothetical protein